jgi:ABC-type nickel/cobalt efflux system permease component RcnA
VKRIFAAAAVIAAMLLPGVVSAHPLGNFTVNHYARIEPTAHEVRVVYVLDMAEIPTFQEKPNVDDGYAQRRAEQIGANLHLTANSASIPLHVAQTSLTFPVGAGGLDTLRLEATYAADIPEHATIALRDDNDSDRIGWREIVARPGASDIVIENSSVPSSDVTNELRQYPEDLLSSPLNVRQAQFSVAPGASMVTQNGTNSVLDRTRSAFAELANGADLTPAFVLFAVGVALVLGAAHALQPGHGKTVVAAYLVGSRGTPRHALFLGVTVTATHTAGVYALGFVTLFLSQYVLPERLYPVLEVISGLLVVGIGVWLFGARLLTALGLRRAHEHGHDHAHDHDHEHGHEHHHHHHEISWKSLLALGVSGGILPCPEALMVLLITIAAHRVLFGLLLIVSFSTGLAAVLVGFGLLLVYARGLFSGINRSPNALIPRVLPVASAVVIVVAGSVITAQALPQVL